MKKRSLFKAAAAGTVVALLALALKLLLTPSELNGESYAFLLHYSADRPLLELIFDPALNDWNFYQARELSYLLDWFDATVILALLRHQLIFWWSATSMIATVATVWLFQYEARRNFPRLGGTLVNLGTFWYVLAAGTGGLSFFRSAKPLSALLAVAVLFLAVRLTRTRKLATAAGMAALLLALNLADRQGAFFTAAFAGYAALLLALAPDRLALFSSRRFAVFTVVLFGCVLAGAICNSWIAPSIIHAVNGYWPDFSYQQPETPPPLPLLRKGAVYVGGNLGFQLLGLTGWYAVGAGVIIAGLWLMAARKFANRLPLAVALAAMIVCGGMMVIRHPAILGPEVVFGSYFNVFLAVLLFLLFYTASASRSIRRYAVWLLLAGVAAQLCWLAVGQGSEGIPGVQAEVSRQIRGEAPEMELLPVNAQMFLEKFKTTP